jgi:hypothetical protein
MAATATEVCLIFDTSMTEPQIDQMLLTAENIIVSHIDPKADPLFTTAVRDMVKTWLAAHFCAIKDPQAKEESADGIRTVFRGKADKGLEATMYGQQAMLLDPTGALEKMANGTKRLNFHLTEPRSTTTEV